MLTNEQQKIKKCFINLLETWEMMPSIKDISAYRYIDNYLSHLDLGEHQDNIRNSLITLLLTLQQA